MIYSPKNLFFWLTNKYLVRYYNTKNWLLYYIPALYDPMPKAKRKENTAQYLQRIPAKYAFRHTKYMSFKFRLMALNAKYADFGEYEGKDLKRLEKLRSAILQTSAIMDQQYKEAGFRYLQEKSRTRKI